MKKLKATFSGVDGTSGYTQGQQYTVIVNEDCGGCPEFYVLAVDESFVGRITYDSVLLFFADWKHLIY